MNKTIKQNNERLLLQLSSSESRVKELESETKSLADSNNSMLIDRDKRSLERVDVETALQKVVAEIEQIKLDHEKEKKLRIDAENSLQLIYELDNGIFGSHTNHCGHDVTKWDLELIGPNLRLEANATEKVIKGTIQGKKINEKFGPKNDLGGLDKISAWLKSIQENNKSYIRSSYEESLNTQALIEAAIKSQNSNTMELAEKI